MNKTADRLPCLVCGSQLEIRLAKGRKSGKAFLMIICPVDGRHLRGFISDKEYVGQVLSAIEEGQGADQPSQNRGLGVG